MGFQFQPGQTLTAALLNTLLSGIAVNLVGVTVSATGGRPFALPQPIGEGLVEAFFDGIRQPISNIVYEVGASVFDLASGIDISGITNIQIKYPKVGTSGYTNSEDYFTPNPNIDFVYTLSRITGVGDVRVYFDGILQASNVIRSLQPGANTFQLADGIQPTSINQIIIVYP